VTTASVHWTPLIALGVLLSGVPVTRSPDARVLRVSRGQSSPFTLVILHGPAIHAASGLDAVRNVGVRDGRIASITSGPLSGRDTVDARGLVVAPGFIDLHQHAQDSAAYRVEAPGGITTALELESGTSDAAIGVRVELDHSVARSFAPNRL
jgi:hypothetical protein